MPDGAYPTTDTLTCTFSLLGAEAASGFGRIGASTQMERGDGERGWKQM
jgi:hypothetical protein